MTLLKCPCCSEQEYSYRLFVGIFPIGSRFSCTERNPIALFGCPKCHTIQYVTDYEYIQMRKDWYKKDNK